MRAAAQAPLPLCGVVGAGARGEEGRGGRGDAVGRDLPATQFLCLGLKKGN